MPSMPIFVSGPYGKYMLIKKGYFYPIAEIDKDLMAS